MFRSSHKFLHILFHISSLLSLVVGFNRLTKKYFANRFSRTVTQGRRSGLVFPMLFLLVIRIMKAMLYSSVNHEVPILLPCILTSGLNVPKKAIVTRYAQTYHFVSTRRRKYLDGCVGSLWVINGKRFVVCIETADEQNRPGGKANKSTAP